MHLLQIFSCLISVIPMAAHLLLNGARIALFRTRPIHVHAASVNDGSIEGRDGSLSFGLTARLNESKAPRSCRVSIFDDIYAQHLPKPFEESSQSLF